MSNKYELQMQSRDREDIRELQRREEITPMNEWRVGRKLGRTLYVGEDCVGMVDTPKLAAQIVEAVNNQADIRELRRDFLSLIRLLNGHSGEQQSAGLNRLEAKLKQLEEK